jgi:UDP-N-acetylmuramate dehydrogenase
MTIQENISIQTYNTFGLPSIAKYFATFNSIQTLKDILETDIAKNYPIVILGGGSNIMLTKNVDALVLKNEIMGIDITADNEFHYFVECGAGENWHQFVLWTIEQNMQGAENLSLIPGTVGAAPMQNIGAYGAEIKDIIVGLQAYHIASKEVHTFTNADCAFGYRESIFKNRNKGEYIIINVEFVLNKIPQINTSYGAIKEMLEGKNMASPTAKDVSEAVMAIRQSKLPDPAEIGNAGSFFKNPEISIAHFSKLKNIFADMPGYMLNDKIMKVPAAWLIEKCGWKGYRDGDAGVHNKQALVLVNYGNATGQQIFELSTKILESVKNKFDIELDREVNIW